MYTQFDWQRVENMRFLSYNLFLLPDVIILIDCVEQGTVRDTAIRSNIMRRWRTCILRAVIRNASYTQHCPEMNSVHIWRATQRSSMNVQVHEASRDCAISNQELWLLCPPDQTKSKFRASKLQNLHVQPHTSKFQVTPIKSDSLFLTSRWYWLGCE